MRQIVVATGNKGKLSEIKEILSGFPYEIRAMAELWDPLPDIPETGDTFYQNAKIKADWVYNASGLWALADDSGLEVDALDGNPGVRSARYAGDNADSAANNSKLLAE
ncbi:MAG: non-canonical purine NTP pyrophosphatase, partial [Fibrobacter sp.]|nr:non-canonical purine NTP pyrophosphatase [Fibrobacter sp.]